MDYFSIDQVCDVNPPKDISRFKGMEVSFIPMDAVSTTGEVDVSRTISGDGVKNYSVFQNRDVLFAKITPCMENGKGGIVDDLKNGFGAGSTEFIVIRPDEQNVISEWIQLFLSQSSYRLECKNHMTGSAGQKRVPPTFIAGTVIPVPSVDEQRRIVFRIEEMFSELDNSVSTLQKTKEQLAVYRQASITSAYPVMTKENTKKLSEISDITGGITKGRDLKQAETIFLPYLRVANVQNGFLDLTEIKEIELKADEKEKYLLKKGDVLYTEGGDRDKLGRGTVWNEEIPDCVHQNHVFRARVDKSIAMPEYVAYWSMGSYARTYFFRKGKQTVNLASINKTVLSNLELPIPDLATQEKVLAEIESRLSVCDSIEHTVDTALQQAEAMRQSILKQAFEGRL